MPAAAQPTARADRAATLLRLRGVGKRYGAVVALTAVDVDIAAASVHALVGANGAGKSTLGKIVAGVIRPDAGDLSLDGAAATYSNPREALEVGIALIAQELALAPEMTVIENVYLRAEPRRAGFVDRRRMRQRFGDLLDSSGFELPANLAVGRLSIADQQKVEILRALARGARVIVMDEPTSSLTLDEVEQLHALIDRLRTDGTTVIYVSHFLDQVLDIADTVTVMRNGRVVRTTPAAEETEDDLVAAMLGHDAAAEYPDRRPFAGGDVVLDARGLTRRGSISDVSLDVRRGEIVGLAGLVGSGRSEVLRAIFGSDPIDSGEVRVEGHRLRPLNPRAAIAAGMALVPENRKTQGLLMQQSAAINTTLPQLRFDRGIARSGLVRRRSEEKEVSDLLERLAIKPASPRASVAVMSGGNQQKVLLGRCLFGEPKLLLLDEPTRGVDIGARVATHQLIAELAERGVAIVLVSSDLEEVLGLSDRVFVMRKGRFVAQLEAKPALDTVMQLAFGMPARSPIPADHDKPEVK
jgi:rhamnose transport system ATP-binding protein